MACFIGRASATDTSVITNNAALNYSRSTNSVVVTVTNDDAMNPMVEVKSVSAYYYGPQSEPPPATHLSRRRAGLSTRDEDGSLVAEYPTTGFPVMLRPPRTAPDGTQEDRFLVVRVHTENQAPQGDVRTDPLSAVMNIA